MTIEYLTDLHLIRYREKRKGAQFILSREYRVVVDGHLITVPAEFHTDLASVPRLFRGLVSVVDAIEGSIIHDFLYRIPGEHDRAWADKVLEAMAAEQGASWVRRKMMWLGVRAGGWYTWRQKR